VHAGMIPFHAAVLQNVCMRAFKGNTVCRLQRMEKERLKEASGDNLDKEEKKKKKK